METGEYISDANVSLSPYLEVENEDNGFYTTTLVVGNYDWEVSKTGYDTQTGNVVANGIEDVSVTIRLEKTI